MKLNEEKRLLNNHWQLYYGSMEEDYKEALANMKVSDKTMEVNLPCDVHMPLIEKGIIKDPVLGKYSKDSLWIEDKAWWFYRELKISEDELSEYMNMYLNLDRLDIDGQIYVNGNYVGTHRSSHYPFTKDIKELLTSGLNTIVVRLTTGYETIEEERVKPLEGKIIQCGNRGDKRRAFSRKPQYCSGWDWTERIMTCGINGQAFLLMEQGVTLKEISVMTKSINVSSEEINEATLKIKLNLDNHEFVATKDISLHASIYDGDKVIYEFEESMILRAGNNYYERYVDLNKIELWWPNGYGEQKLYTLKIAVKGYKEETIKFGIRTIKLNQDKLDEENRRFAFEVNNELIFAKGSNWVPSDAIYARVSDHKYRVLIEEAVEQNNNMLRIWGGGIYEPDIFYDLCDEHGILIWHDFMYACSVYPEYEEWFMEESYKEADYQTKRLRNHPCIALWCGNNEMHWIYGEEAAYKLSPGEMKASLHKIYNYMLPEIVNKNIEDNIYWNSSPYGGFEASTEQMGDNHIWPSHRNEKPVLAAYSTYDDTDTKFMSEYGYIGPCKIESITEYCDTNSIDYEKDEYKYHSHYFEKTYEGGMVAKGIKQQYGVDKKLSLENYLLLGGMAQGKLLEYSLEAYRSHLDCSGALLWMYNDAWGEEGWTTIDYYLNRKISYHYVRRALAPLKLIMKVKGQEVHVIGINETDQDKVIVAEIGFVSFNGKRETTEVELSLDKRSREVILRIPYVKRVDEGLYFVRPTHNREIDKAILVDYYQHEIPKVNGELSFEIMKDKTITIKSSGYAHGAHFNLPAHTHLSDEYFDMLPGEVRELKAIDVTDEQLNELCIKSYNPEKV